MSENINTTYFNSTKQYMKEISKYPLLTEEEEKAICLRVSQGDQAAKEELIQKNLRLVVSIAKHYSNFCSIPFLDLVQEGNLGLLKAVDKFELEKNCKFSTLATWWIKQTISRAISDQGRTIRIPANLIELSSKISRIIQEYEQCHNGEEPSIKYLAEKSGEKEKTIEKILFIIKEPISLESPINDEDNTIGDLIPDEENDAPGAALIREDNKNIIKNVLNTLEEKEKNIIILRYGIGDRTPKTLEEIGEIYGLTKERIRQIEIKALRKLRNPLRKNMLQEYYNE